MAVSLGLALAFLPIGRVPGGVEMVPLGKRFKDWSYDLLFLVSDRAPPADIALVLLNETSYEQLRQDPKEFDRKLHARLVDRLREEGARTIVFDILFVEDSKPISDADRDFARAIREHGKVVLAGTFERSSSLFERLETRAPLPIFRDAGARWGLALLHRDSDFSARLHHPGTDRFPSLAWKAAELDGAAVTRLPEARFRERWLNYYAEEPFPWIDYYLAVEQPTLGGFSVSNKVVFVGARADVTGYAGEARDHFAYPWTWISGRAPSGVETHAITFANLVRGDWLRRTGSGWEAALILLAGIGFGYGLPMLRPIPALGIALAGSVGIFGFAWLLFAQFNTWFPWLILAAIQVPFAFGWALFYNSVRSFIEKQLLERSLALYLSPKQVKRILKQPDLLKPGAVEQEVSILFSDIANFSKVSEQLDPEDLVQLLNQYYEATIACIHDTDGTVMNLIGDAIFALWNAPQFQTDHPARACRAAILLQARLVDFDRSQRSLPLFTRVGLHRGKVCVGNIGSSTHFDYTAIGESVNLASRLEGLNKQVGTSILATRDMQKAVEDQITSRLVGRFRFKGFDQIVPVYEILSFRDAEEQSRAWREVFTDALYHFNNKKWDEAELLFKRTCELRQGEDGPAKFYLMRVAEFRSRAKAGLLPENWLGELDLSEK